MKKLFKILFLMSLLNVQYSLVNAQNSQIKRTNNWYFGTQAGINFNGGTPNAVIDGQINNYAGCSSISDTMGNLLMYTDGQNVWNKNHQIMPNGTGLLGMWTPVQGSVIIPKPLDDNLYYIFTISGNDGPHYGIRYSIVDMALNGGLGDVTVKNELIFQPSSEQLGATMHANCTDVWIMGHELNSNKYRSYLLTATGIDTNNVVINDIGNFSPYTGIGLKFSPNGKKMAASNYWDNINTPQNLDTLDLFDFDNSTGVLSNLIKLPDTTIVAFSFSPDDKLLYVVNYNTEMGNLNIVPGAEEVFQYDITSNIEATVKSTKTVVYYPLRHDFSDLQVGADKKIYAANPSNDSISVINFPNTIGFSCNIVEGAISLNGKISQTQLPNFVSSYFNQDSSAGCFYSVGINEIDEDEFFISVYPNPFVTTSTISVATGIINQNSTLTFSVNDLMGKEVISIKNNQQIQSNSVYEFDLNRGNLSSGIYLLNININSKTSTQKIIITN